MYNHHENVSSDFQEILHATSLPDPQIPLNKNRTRDLIKITWRFNIAVNYTSYAGQRVATATSEIPSNKMINFSYIECTVREYQYVKVLLYCYMLH